MYREAQDGPTKLIMEPSGYGTIKIRVTQGGRGIGVVWEGGNKTKAATVWEFLCLQTEHTWMNLKRDRRPR